VTFASTSDRRRRARHRSLEREWLLALILFMALIPVPARPQLIPESAQLPIYFKLLTYDRTLWENPDESLRIGLLHRHDSEESHRNLSAMVTALTASTGKTVNGLDFQFTTVGWGSGDDVADKIGESDVDVLYVTAGHEDHLEAVAMAARSAGVLTMSGREGYAHRWLSVGLDLEGERPRIEVNLEALAAEGHQLDARVLRICKVVRR